jgi:hypothetical protein
VEVIKALEDEEKLDEAADDAISLLKSKGRFKLK